MSEFAEKLVRIDVELAAFNAAYQQGHLDHLPRIEALKAEQIEVKAALECEMGLG